MTQVGSQHIMQAPQVMNVKGQSVEQSDHLKMKEETEM